MHPFFILGLAWEIFSHSNEWEKVWRHIWKNLMWRKIALKIDKIKFQVWCGNKYNLKKCFDQYTLPERETRWLMKWLIVPNEARFRYPILTPCKKLFFTEHESKDTHCRVPSRCRNMAENSCSYLSSQEKGIYPPLSHSNQYF